MINHSPRLKQGPKSKTKEGKIYVPGLSNRGRFDLPKEKAIPNLRGPKKVQFTAHSRAKMRQYGLSESRIKRVINSPRRIEEGIAPKTIAMMQPTTSFGKTWKQEIWVMIQDEKTSRKIISSWRYPGITKPGEPLPDEILKEIKSII